MDVRVKFFGGAQSVTGSRYLLEIDEFRLLVDCGLFQGLKALRLRNWEDPPFDVTTLDAIVLTHAHIDHSGYLPRMKKLGFTGPIYCTTATADLLGIMLRDAAKLQEEEANYAKKKGYSKHKNPQPLYDQKDVEALLPQLRPIAFQHTFQITPAIRLTFHIAGHILGAAIVELYLQGKEQLKKVVFSGDLGRKGDPLMYPPTTLQEADVLFVESTYGGRSVVEASPVAKIGKIINETFEREGVVLIPAFSVGRTQNILYYLKTLFDEGAIPEDTEIFVDSPMAIAATALYVTHHEVHKISLSQLNNEDSFIHLRRQLILVRSHEASVYLNQKRKNAIIISASGMMTGGRILHHLANRLPNANDTLLVVGFQAVGTRGRRIIDGESPVKMLGQEIPVRCHVAQIDGLSAHADQTELIHWLKHFSDRPKFTFLVHGEQEGLSAFQQEIKEQLGWDAIIPDYLESYHLFKNI